MATEPCARLDHETGNETSSETSEVAQNIVLTLKITRKSPIWTYFHLAESETSEDQSEVSDYSVKQSHTAICLLCKSAVVAK